MKPLLYHFTGATCAVKVMLALDEKGVDYEERLLSRDDLATPDYRAINPDGQVPTLIHGAAVLVESSIIMTYVDEAFEGPPLRPMDPLGRATVARWLRRVDDAFAALTFLTYAIFARRGFLDRTAEEREAYYRGIRDPAKRHARREMIEDGLDSPQIPIAVETLGRLQDAAEETLTEREFLVGDYSLADAALAPFVDRIELLGLLRPSATHPQLACWLAATRARPSFRRAVTERQSSELRAAIHAAAAAAAPRLVPPVLQKEEK